MITSGFQRGLMKAVGASARHLAQVVGVHLTQGLHGCQHALRGPARRAVPAPPARPACNGAGWRSSRDQVQVVEAFRPGQQLGLADALGELVPGNHRLDGGIGVAAAFLRFQQRLADPGVQAHLVVDRLALLLELLLMLVLRAAEQLDQDAVMQIDQLIDHGRGVSSTTAARVA